MALAGKQNDQYCIYFMISSYSKSVVELEEARTKKIHDASRMSD